jgi:hypothetical protein
MVGGTGLEPLAGWCVKAVEARTVAGMGGGPWSTVPELFFDKKQLIPALKQLLLS